MAVMHQGENKQDEWSCKQPLYLVFSIAKMLPGATEVMCMTHTVLWHLIACSKEITSNKHNIL